MLGLREPFSPITGPQSLLIPLWVALSLNPKHTLLVVVAIFSQASLAAAYFILILVSSKGVLRILEAHLNSLNLHSRPCMAESAQACVPNT